MLLYKLDKSIDLYIDDKVVKSSQAKSHLEYLQDLFTRLAKYNVRLNPTKCTFRLQGEKFLGYLMTAQGVEANIDQVRAMAKLSSPRTKKESKSLLDG